MQDRELTPKQQTSEAVRQAESILIISGQHPSVDQAASTMALAAVLRKFGKKVTAVISDELPAGVRWLPSNLIENRMDGLRDFIVQVDLSHAEVDKLKYTIENGKLNVHISPFAGSFKAKDVSFDYGDFHYDMVIVLGVASYSRIDRVYAQYEQKLRQIPLVNIDYHRSNEMYGAINLIDTNAASLGEILVALAESLQTGIIDKDIATMLLTSIVASTDRFTASHTTPKALTVAAQMMAVGADQRQVVQGLYRKDKGGGQPRQDKPERQDKPKAQPHSMEASRSQSVSRPEQPAAQSQPVAQPQPVPQPQPAPQPPTPDAPVQNSQSEFEPQSSGIAVHPAIPQENKTMIAGGRITPEMREPVMQELLPPSHLELMDPPGGEQAMDELEPLINAPDEPAQPRRESPGPKAQNPANNPLYSYREP